MKAGKNHKAPIPSIVIELNKNNNKSEPLLIPTKY